MKKFIEKYDPACLQSLDEHGFSIMHYVARDSSLDVAEYLCSLDVEHDSHLSNKNGQRPIHWAAVKGRIEMINFLSTLFLFLLLVFFWLMCVLLTVCYYLS